MQLHNIAGSFHNCILTSGRTSQLEEPLPAIWIKDYKDSTVSVWSCTSFLHLGNKLFFLLFSLCNSYQVPSQVLHVLPRLNKRTALPFMTTNVFLSNHNHGQDDCGKGLRNIFTYPRLFPICSSHHLRKNPSWVSLKLTMMFPIFRQE